MKYRAALHPSLRGKWAIYEIRSHRWLNYVFRREVEAQAKVKRLNEADFAICNSDWLFWVRS